MAAKTKGRRNIVNKLSLRETLGSLRPVARAKTVKLFDKRVFCIPLDDILPTDGGLQKGHVLLGFTKDGRYLISYKLTIDAEFDSHLPHYGYSLHWWEFHQTKPLVQVHSVPLFEGEDIQLELQLIISQTLDETQVIVWGISLYQPVFQSHGCFVTVCSAPPNNPCGSCAAKAPQGRCMKHSYAVHMKYDLLPPFPWFVPSLSLRLNNTILFNTGDQLMALSVETKCGDSPDFSVGNEHFQSDKGGSCDYFSHEGSSERRSEADACDGCSVEVINENESRGEESSVCCCPREDINENRQREEFHCEVSHLPDDFTRIQKSESKLLAARKFADKTAYACCITCATGRTNKKQKLPGRPGIRKASDALEQKTKDSDTSEEETKAVDNSKLETKDSDASEEEKKTADNTKLETKVSDASEEEKKAAGNTKLETKVSDAPEQEKQASEKSETFSVVVTNDEADNSKEYFDCFVESTVEEGRLSDSFEVKERTSLTVFNCKVYAETESDESDSGPSYVPSILPVAATAFSGKTLKCLYTSSSQNTSTCHRMAAEFTCPPTPEVLVVKQACLDIEQCINQLIHSHEVLRTQYKSLSDYDAQIVYVNPDSFEVTVLVKLLLYTRITSVCTPCEIPVSPRPILQTCGFVLSWNVQTGSVQRIATMQPAHYTDKATKSGESRAASEVAELRKHCFVPVGVSGAVRALSNHSTFSGKSLKFLRHPYLPLAIVFGRSPLGHNPLRA